MPETLNSLTDNVYERLDDDRAAFADKEKAKRLAISQASADAHKRAAADRAEDRSLGEAASRSAENASRSMNESLTATTPPDDFIPREIPAGPHSTPPLSRTEALLIETADTKPLAGCTPTYDSCPEEAEDRPQAERATEAPAERADERSRESGPPPATGPTAEPQVGGPCPVGCDPCTEQAEPPPPPEPDPSPQVEPPGRSQEEPIPTPPREPEPVQAAPGAYDEASSPEAKAVDAAIAKAMDALPLIPQGVLQARQHAETVGDTDTEADVTPPGLTKTLHRTGFVTLDGIAGEALVPGDIIHFDAGKVKKIDNSTEAKAAVVGIAANAATLNEWRDRVIGAQAIVLQAKDRRDDADEDVKAAKATLKARQTRFEEVMNELLDTISGKPGKESQALLPFGEVGAVDGPDSLRGSPGAEPGESSGSIPPPSEGDSSAWPATDADGNRTVNVLLADEDWKKEQLRDLGLQPGVVNAMNEAGMFTLGGVANYTKADGEGRSRNLTDIPGIGEKGAEKIEAAMDAYFAESNTLVPVDDLTGYRQGSAEYRETLRKAANTLEKPPTLTGGPPFDGEPNEQEGGGEDA